MIITNMQELIEKVEKTKKWANTAFHKLDTFDVDLDIEEAGVNLEKLERRIANLGPLSLQHRKVVAHHHCCPHIEAHQTFL